MINWKRVRDVVATLTTDEDALNALLALGFDSEDLKALRGLRDALDRAWVDYDGTIAIVIEGGVNDEA